VARHPASAPATRTCPSRARPGPAAAGPARSCCPLIKPGTVSTACYNHYSLLRSIEDIFALPHLGDAAMPQVGSFGPDVFR
jgi:phosphatidylinositol-3-phosphatase